jgi:hypothetical protein
VAPDGSFVFGGVAPGAYTVRAVGFADTPLSQDGDLTVDAGKDSDVVIAAEPFILGKVVMENGEPLPAEANTVAGDTAARALVSVTVVAPAGVNNTLVSGASRPVRADGSFVLLLKSRGGEHYFLLPQLPLGYSVKSLSYGAMDVPRMPGRLRVHSTDDGSGPVDISENRELRVVLTAEPGPRFKVSGRVLGPLPQTARPAVYIIEGAANARGPHEAEVSPREDGTFEFRQIPPGIYMVRWLGSQGVASIEVTDQDVQGIELQPSPTSRVPSSTILTAIFNLESIILQKTGPENSDCGAFDVVNSLISSTDIDAVIECARTAMSQRKSFFVVMRPPATDMGSTIVGFVGDTNGRIYRLENSLLTECAPQAVLIRKRTAVRREELACERPPSAITR